MVEPYKVLTFLQQTEYRLIIVDLNQCEILCMMYDTIQHLTRAKLNMKIEKKKINLMLFNSYRIHFSVIPFVNHDYTNNNNQTLSVDFIVSCISSPSRFTTITITTNVTTLLCICRMVGFVVFFLWYCETTRFPSKIRLKIICTYIMHHVYSYLVSSL